MPEERELLLDWDDKFGELLHFTIIDEYNKDMPLFIAKIRKKVDYIAIHRCYVKGNELRLGKGIRIPIDGGEADLAILAIQAITMKGELIDEVA